MVNRSIYQDGSAVTFVKTHAGKVRPYNEDAVLDMSRDGVWVVADGMGGHAAGDVASQMVVDAIQQCVEQAPPASVTIDDLRKALIHVNKQVIEYAKLHLSGKTMGSTVVLLLISGGHFHCLWAGDSRMYQMRTGQLRQKTRDHSQVMDMLEQGLISAHEVENHPLSNVITRAVGVDKDLNLAQTSGQLLPNDMFLLCSDGLTNELNDRELTLCLKADTVSDSGLALMHSALVKGAKDNVSCVLVKVHSAEEAIEPLNDTVPVFLSRS